jgi:nucleotide-binding universal stress UspA family protein
MNRNILVPLDGSKETEAILPEVLRIATPEDRIHFLHVVPPVPAPAGLPVSHLIGLLEQALAYLQTTRQKALPGRRGLDLVRSGDAAQEILGVALEKNIHLIAMSTHARTGLSRFLLGSVAAKVVEASQLPVLLVRPALPRASTALRKILVAVEGSETASDLLESVKTLAAPSTAEIILFHAVEPVADPSPQWRAGPLSILSTPEHRLQDLADRLEQEGYVAWPVVSQGAPVEEILRQARRLEVDLIALATHARSGLERMLDGSVAEGVLKQSPVPVLLQKPLRARKTVLEGERHA